ncbi:MAG: ATP-NAD kinase family protein [Methanobacteriota archaeon]
MEMKRLGLIVNPIAGMGGRVGLKGTDGPEILLKARKLGAEPVAPARTVKALLSLKKFFTDFELFAYPTEMGMDEARESGLEAKVIGKIATGRTTPDDTKRAAKEMWLEGVDLLIFAGGDGTASDLLESVGKKVPIIGIPTGVKMHSAVFANNPEAAGEVAARFLRDGLPLRDAEVVDVDEDAFRGGRLVTKLIGYVSVPYEPVMVQSTKEGSTGYERADQKAIARWVFELMEKGRIYVLGPGTTTRAVAEELGIHDSTLLGVDIIQESRLLAKDVGEEQILKAMKGKRATIIVSPIGKQGFILGRGNLQLSPEVLKQIGKENVWVIATPQKIACVSSLKVDTEDVEIDNVFRGYMRVITGYHESRIVKVI